MQNQKLAHLVVASSWRPACLPSPQVVDLLSPRRTARPPGKAPGGTEGGQAARRQEPRRGELERRLRVERD